MGELARAARKELGVKASWETDTNGKLHESSRMTRTNGDGGVGTKRKEQLDGDAFFLERVDVRGTEQYRVQVVTLPAHPNWQFIVSFCRSPVSANIKRWH